MKTKIINYLLTEEKEIDEETYLDIACGMILFVLFTISLCMSIVVA